MGESRTPDGILGRYVLRDRIASGGTAAVYVGRLIGPVGFAKTVAIKRLHDQFAKDPDFVSMFLDEACIASRIAHPNVVAVLDVISGQGELFLVMEYVHGPPLSMLMRRTKRLGKRIEPRVAASIAIGLLHGLHAAHEARRENGTRLEIVHRDVSPQNVLVGVDGVARLFDFGMAKSVGSCHSTGVGEVKGKLGYMAPEQVSGEAVDRRTDVFAAGIVLWEMLAGEPLYVERTANRLLAEVLTKRPAKLSELQSGLPAAVDGILAKALQADPARRYATARDLAVALETALPPATPREVGDWVEQSAGEWLDLLTVKLTASERGAVECRSSKKPPTLSLSPEAGERESWPPRQLLVVPPHPTFDSVRSVPIARRSPYASVPPPVTNPSVPPLDPGPAPTMGVIHRKDRRLRLAVVSTCTVAALTMIAFGPSWLGLGAHPGKSHAAPGPRILEGPSVDDAHWALPSLHLEAEDDSARAGTVVFVAPSASTPLMSSATSPSGSSHREIAPGNAPQRTVR